MKFGHLKECNMRNITLEKTCTKCGEETSPRPLCKESKLSQKPKFDFNSLFSLHVEVEDYRNMLKLPRRQLAFTKAFLKNKEVWN